MFYREDFDGVVDVTEADTVVANAKTELRRINVLESLYVTFASGEKASQRVQNAHSSGLFDSAEVGLGSIAPHDFLRHGLAVRAGWVGRGIAHALGVFGAESEFRENFLVRDAFATSQ